MSCLVEFWYSRISLAMRFVRFFGCACFLAFFRFDVGPLVLDRCLASCAASEFDSRCDLLRLLPSLGEYKSLIVRDGGLPRKSSELLLRPLFDWLMFVDLDCRVLGRSREFRVRLDDESTLNGPLNPSLLDGGPSRESVRVELVKLRSRGDTRLIQTVKKINQNQWKTEIINYQNVCFTFASITFRKTMLGPCQICWIGWCCITLLFWFIFCLGWFGFNFWSSLFVGCFWIFFCGSLFSAHFTFTCVDVAKECVRRSVLYCAVTMSCECKSIAVAAEPIHSNVFDHIQAISDSLPEQLRLWLSENPAFRPVLKMTQGLCSKIVWNRK